MAGYAGSRGIVPPSIANRSSTAGQNDRAMGANTDGHVPPNTVITNIHYGDWLKVTDSQIEYERSYVSDLLDKYLWNLGSVKINLQRNEIRCEHGWGIFSYYPKNCYIRVTANTINGFVATGVIPQASVAEILRDQNQANKAEASKPTIAGGITKLGVGLIVIGLAAAAIWFIPRKA